MGFPPTVSEMSIEGLEVVGPRGNVIRPAVLAVALLLAIARPGLAQFVQQGPPLTNGWTYPSTNMSATLGGVVSISADGNTAVFGSPLDDGPGPVFIWTRTNGIWHQGPRLPVVFHVGSPVAISGDGATVIVGSLIDGVVWIFTGSGDNWTQQGPALMGSGAPRFREQGGAVALSFDGNTAIVGGAHANSDAGATWVWTRSGGVWTQSAVLVGSDAAGAAQQGGAVALSADGSTAIVGGRADNGGTGAAWIWVRGSTGWAQQGPKLVGTGAVGASAQGWSVAIAGDGRTALVSGPNDDGVAGAVWVWTVNSGAWTQQGPKLVGAGAVGKARQGGGNPFSDQRSPGNAAVSVSFDGNVAIVGGPDDDTRQGAAWIWRRTGDIWTQQGPKLTAEGAASGTFLGYSVSLSADGSLALVGSLANEVWVYAFTQLQVTGLVSLTPLPSRFGTPIVWAASGTANGGEFAFWRYDEPSEAWTPLQAFGGNATVTWTPTLWDVGHHILRVEARWAGWPDGPIASRDMPFEVLGPPPSEPAIMPPAADFNGDRRPDIVWANPTTGELAWWGLGGGAHGETLMGSNFLNAPALPAGWHVVGSGDVDRDGHSDLFLESDVGQLGVWFFDGSVFRFGMSLTPGQVTDTNWRIRAVGDFNHDGHPDLVWQYVPTGQLAFWLLDGTTVMNYVIPAAPAPGADWVIVGAGDSNRDGDLDLFWQQQSTGTLAVWRMHGTTLDAGLMLSASPGATWVAVAVADLDGDAFPDVVLQDSGTNQVAAWYFADTTLRFGAMLSPSAAGSAEWRIVGPR